MSHDATSTTNGGCSRHSEHAQRPSGTYGRHFPDMDRWPEGQWEPCDAGLGAWVYCCDHRRPHSTGWCTVSNADKIPLNANSRDDAYQKARDRGLPIYGDSSNP